MNVFDLGIIEGMEKVAASIADLQKGFRRLGVVRAKIKNPKGIMQKMIKATTQGKKLRVGPREMALLGGGAATHPSKRVFQQVLKQQPRAVRRTMLAGGVPREAVRHAEETMNEARKKLRMMKPGKKPVIIMGKGKISPSKTFSQMTGKQLSPHGKKGVNLTATMHEQFERSAMKGKRPVHFGYGHVSPEVLAKEHNLLARLTGKGSQETRGAVQKAREISGDSEALNQLLKKRFGERAGIAFGKGQKIPKAMRKALRRGPISKIWQRMPGGMF